VATTPPESVRVVSTVYTLSFDSRDWKDRGDRWGDCDHEKQLIHVEPDLAADMQRRVVLHEILHACFQEFHDADRKLSPEEVCRGLEAALLCVLRDNPALVTWLLAPGDTHAD
jgi:hypothetical protein